MPTKAKWAKAAEPLEVEEGSGRVFEDQGLPDAARRLAKAEMVRVIRKIVEERGLA